MASDEALTRQKYTELKFNHQIEKAHRKGKLVELHYPIDNSNYNIHVVDPALVLFRCMMLDKDTQFRMRITQRRNSNPDSPVKCYTLNPDRVNAGEDVILNIVGEASPAGILKLITEADPTPNKEYVQWVLMMYTRILKDREPTSGFDDEANKMGGDSFLFFENLAKLFDALTTFHRIKNTKLLSQDQKDIYTYRSIDSFVATVMTAQIVPAEIQTSGADNTINVLSSKELDEIKHNRAKLLYQDQDWIVVHTVTQEANAVFGENTTWCTAGTRHSTMFEHYNRQGKLFVLLKNKAGAAAHLKTNPLNRMQFHFESDQFMNSLDRRIDILLFFRDYPNVKNYFREYIVESLLKVHKSKVDEMLKVLKKYGMVRELIPILRDMKTKVLNLTGFVSGNSDFELGELGTIITLEDLTLRDCMMTEVPEAIRPLKNLKILRLSGNKIKKIPSWINEFPKLEQLNVMKNEICEPFDVSGLTNLISLNMGFNKSMKELPTGLKNLKKLEEIDFALSGVSEIPDDITECTSLIQINAIRNKALIKIPDNIIKLPKLLFLGIDETGIPVTKKNQLEQMKSNRETTIV